MSTGALYLTFKTGLKQNHATVKNKTHANTTSLTATEYEAHVGMINAVKILGGKALDPTAETAPTLTAKNAKHSLLNPLRFRTRLLNPKWIQSLKQHATHAPPTFPNADSFSAGTPR
jgi:cobalamin biosynthesis Mg chelatase CobN